MHLITLSLLFRVPIVLRSRRSMFVRKWVCSQVLCSLCGAAVFLPLSTCLLKNVPCFFVVRRGSQAEGESHLSP